MNIPCQFGLLARQTGLIHVFLRINDTTGLLDFHYLIPIQFHLYRHIRIDIASLNCHSLITHFFGRYNG